MAKTKRKTATARKATTTRKTAAKVKVTKTKTTKKSVAKKIVPLKMKKTDKPLTKVQQVAYISEQTGVAKKDVVSVFECCDIMIQSHLCGPGSISMAGLVKILLQKKPATKARKGVNPFTGEPTIFKAKPARNVVKVRALKRLKDMNSGA
jgi:nucleoid DNA-binding protein